MLRRYKRTIYKLTATLRKVEAQKDDYALLLGLQQEIARAVRRSERKIAALRARKSAIQKVRKKEIQTRETSRKSKAQIREAEDQIIVAQFLLFLWRCYGDGIAFLSLDKYALKQTLYNVHDYEAKRPPGPLSKKIGFSREWSVVRGLCKHGVPALLCDITNTIRHGDVCVLIGPDPFLIEVKASHNINPRVLRQVANIEKLQHFLAEDRAEDFRGLREIRRSSVSRPDVDYAANVNACMVESLRIGVGCATPEAGLYYVCIGPAATSDQLSQVAPPQECLVNFPQAAKSSSTWMPYTPFTLSIRDADALYAFIVDDITLLIAVHIPTMLSLFESRGFHAVLVDDENVAMTITPANFDENKDPRLAISRAFFARVFYEFLSLDWFVENAVHRFKDVEDTSNLTALKTGEKKEAWPSYVPLKWWET
jgi:hypothetical protein